MHDIPREMIIQAANGDMEAFERIYRSISDFIYNIAYRITNNKEEAQEVTQDVFLKIYNNLKSFRFESAFKTWVYRIATNTAINASKRISRDFNRKVEYNDEIEVQYNQMNARDSADSANNEELIQNMLNTLNSEQRACIILRNIEGLSYKEIADTLKIKINTVRSRLSRARESLLALKTKEKNNELQKS